VVDNNDKGSTNIVGNSSEDKSGRSNLSVYAVSITVWIIFRLLDPGKAEIMRKSTQLTKEIRLYNSIVKYEDTVTLTAEEAQPETESQSLPATEVAPQSIEANGSSSTSQKQTENENENEKKKEISIQQEELKQKEQPIGCDLIEVAMAGEDTAIFEKQLDVDVRGIYIFFYCFQLILRTCLDLPLFVASNCANPILTNWLSLLADNANRFSG